MKALLIVILIHISLLGVASDYQVYGKLKDGSTSEPIEFATIAIRDINSNELISSLISDSKGEFLFKIKPGSYNLVIRCLGYEPVQRILRVEGRDVYLNTIKMKVDSRLLNEVSISASNVVEKHDREIHTVTRQFKAGTNTVNDLLTKIRGVDVDPLDNSIRVNNDNKVLLLLNGIEKDQNYIKKISPERIVRIEVISNPTGRYLTQGYSSVINVILKKDYCGYELFMEDRGLYSLDKSNGDDFLFSNSVNLSCTYTYKKFNIYGTFLNSRSNTNLLSTDSKSMGDNLLVRRSINGKPNSLREGFSNNILLGTDIFINSRQSISLETNFTAAPLDDNSSQRSYNNILMGKNNIEDSFTSQLNVNHSDNASYSMMAYRFNISESSQLEFDYGFNHIKRKVFNSYLEGDENIIDQNTGVERNTSKAELNFRHSFSKKHAIDLGYRNTYRKSSNDYYFNGNVVDAKDIKDMRNAFYTHFSYTPKGKIKTKIGFALEHNKLESVFSDNHYFSFQPYINVNYRYSKKCNVTLKLNSNSEYPYVDQVNPYESIIDRFTSQIGNPSLAFATNYNTSVDIKLFNNKISIEPFYNVSDDFISKTGTIEDNKFRYSYSNMDDYQSVGFNVSTRLTVIKKKMFFNFTGSFYWDETRIGAHTNRINDFNINTNLMYISPRKRTMCALMLKRMNTKRIHAYGYNNNNNDYLSVFVRHPFLKKRAAITMLYMLPVDTGLDYIMKDKFELGEFSQISKTDVRLLKNLFLLKLTFSLHKGNRVNTIEKKDFKDKKPEKGFI